MLKKTVILNFLKEHSFNDKKTAYSNVRSHAVSCSPLYFTHVWSLYQSQSVSQKVETPSVITKFNNMTDVEIHTKNLIKKHLGDDWRFEWHNRRNAAGTCWQTRQLIQLSSLISSLNLHDFNFINNTILHEIAHGLNWIRNHGRGHDYRWKQICYEIGCSGQRCYDSNAVVTPIGRYKYVCPKCGHISYSQKLRTRQYACSSCCKKYNNNRFDSRFVLQLTH